MTFKIDHGTCRMLKFPKTVFCSIIFITLSKQKVKNMKKIVLVALTLFVAGTMYADKKCCKDKASCSKSETKACSKTAEGKSCGSHKDMAKETVNADGTVVATPSCSKTAGGKSCCKNKAQTSASVAPAQDAKPASDK